MSHTALWIDHEKAQIFDYSANGIEERSIVNSNNTYKDEEHRKKFFHEVAQALNNAEKVFILGPGTAKEEFKHHCENHHHKHLAQSIVGVSTMKDHATKAEILKEAGKFYSSYFNWKDGV